MFMILQFCALDKKLPILLKKHWKLLLTEEMQKLFIFPWLNEDLAPVGPVLPSFLQTKLFLSCNPLFPTEVLAELQLLSMQDNQLISLAPYGDWGHPQ